MATACLYENDADRKLHSRAVEMLARDFNIPEEKIQVLYENRLYSFKERARIKDYLAILVSRNVKDIIKRDTSRRHRERKPKLSDIRDA